MTKILGFELEDSTASIVSSIAVVLAVMFLADKLFGYDIWSKFFPTKTTTTTTTP